MEEWQKPYKLKVREIEFGREFAPEASRLLAEGVALKHIASDWGISEPTARRYLRLSGERWRRGWISETVREG